jgi:hypothetical protein
MELAANTGRAQSCMTAAITGGLPIIILSGVYMALRERQLGKPVTLAIVED